ncbi:MAG: sterol desaturase family protein [Rhodospirillales bacterium]
MNDWLLAHETPLRLGAFAGVLALVALAEIIWPRRPWTQSKAYRWTNNLAMVALNTLLLRLVFPIAAVGVALWAESADFGLFNGPGLDKLGLGSGAPAVIASVLLLDLAIWAQHVVFHKVPILWRLHRLHHADLDYDVTTGARFHPLEILLSMAIKMAVVAGLGAPAAAVILFEVLLNASAMFNHGNLRLPTGLDRLLRLVIVTPDMHRVHHSWRRAETDSNYGFNLSVWDRMFATYQADSRDGQEGLTIGLETFRDPANLRLDRLLTLPFRKG